MDSHYLKYDKVGPTLVRGHIEADSVHRGISGGIAAGMYAVIAEDVSLAGERAHAGQDGIAYRLTSVEVKPLGNHGVGRLEIHGVRAESSRHGDEVTWIVNITCAECDVVIAAAHAHLGRQ